MNTAYLFHFSPARAREEGAEPFWDDDLPVSCYFLRPVAYFVAPVVRTPCQWADAIFASTQNHDTPWCHDSPRRSTAIGDVVVIEDGGVTVALVCTRMGSREANAAVAHALSRAVTRLGPDPESLP